MRDGRALTAPDRGDARRRFGNRTRPTNSLSGRSGSNDQFTVASKDAAKGGYVIIGRLAKIPPDRQESSPTEGVTLFITVRDEPGSKQEVIDSAEVPAIEMLIQVGGE